jgi:hypothetical protein
MLKLKIIQWKALSLLIIFTANFSVVCHCSASAAPIASCHRNSCCESHQKASHRPCDDKGGCPATHALKFNLSEKQIPASVHPGPLFADLVIRPFFVPASIALPTTSRECQYLHKHSPPDLQALYQRFLI